MKYFYDTSKFFPYLCLSEITKDGIKSLVGYIREKGIMVNKFYEQPKYPASNGITYQFLLRLGFTNNEKPKSSFVEDIINSFLTQVQKSANVKKPSKTDFEVEKEYIEHVRHFVDTERKIIEIDKGFIREQIEYLNRLSTNLQVEYDRIINFRNNYSDSLSNEIKELIKNSSNSNEENKLIEEKLTQKENLLSEKEKELDLLKSELVEQRTNFDLYIREREEEYASNIRFFANQELLGKHEPAEDDSIQSIKVLVFGDSKLNQKQIFEIFNQEFQNKFFEPLEKTAVDAIYLSYKEPKNSNIIDRILKDKYDYIIVGPHDHSIKGKDAKKSFRQFIKDNNLKAIVNEENNKTLGKDHIQNLAEQIITNWDEQFESE